MVLTAGSAYRLNADTVLTEFRHGSALPGLLLRYTAALIAQIGQTAVCNRYHSVAQQTCRCILAILDRVPSNDLAITQHLIADMLGVRREGVSEALGCLQKAGAIQCRRGHMAVLHRERLEARACECHMLDRRAYDHLVETRSMTKLWL